MQLPGALNPWDATPSGMIGLDPFPTKRPYGLIDPAFESRGDISEAFSSFILAEGQNPA